MPAPFLWLAGGALASTLGQRAVDRVADIFIGDPEKRSSGYKANYKLPNLIPSVGDLIRMWHEGRWKSHEDFADWLLYHGIELGDPAETKYSKGVWSHVIAAARSRPDVAMVIDLYNRQTIDRKEALSRLRELGWSVEKERGLVLGMESLLPEGQVYELYWRGMIDRREAGKLLTSLGFRSEGMHAKILDRKPPLNLQDVRDLANRRLLDEAGVKERFARLGITDEEDVGHLRSLLTFMPPTSDLIRFAVKDVFDPRKAGLEEMRAELKEQAEMLALMDAQGIRDITLPDAEGKPRKWEVPLYYWIASYDELAPGQSFEFLHRLRPNRVERYRFRVDPKSLPPGIRVPAGTRLVQVDPDGMLLVEPEPFVLADVLKALKDKDTNPVYRTRHAATSYRLPGRIDIRRFYQDGVYGDPQGVKGWKVAGVGRYEPVGPAERELYEVYQDEGRSPFDAAQMGYWTSLNWDRERGDAERNRVARLLCRSFQLGAIDKAALIQRLQALGFQRREAQSRADNCDLERAVQTTETTVKAIRAAFLAGRIDDLEVGRQLDIAGVTPERIGNFLRLWKVELLGKTPEPRAAQMCEWVGAGLLTIGEMRTRLERLHWKQDDIERIVKHCLLGHLAKAGKEQERLAAARAREQDRLRRAAERLAQRREREIRQVTEAQKQEAMRRLRESREGHTPPLLAKYLARGLISAAEARLFLLERGWLPADVERWLAARG